MNHDLRFHFVEARDRADFYTVGEFASVTFLGHNVGHGVSVSKWKLIEKTLLRVMSDHRESTPNAWGVELLDLQIHVASEPGNIRSTSGAISFRDGFESATRPRQFAAGASN
jgi:hypothetical protein